MNIDESLYNDRLLALASSISQVNRLEQPHASATAHSKLCGSTITVDIQVQNNFVSNFGYDIKSCALGKASTAIMQKNIRGSAVQELKNIRHIVQAMLKNDGPPPTGKWADVALLQPVKDYKARHASTLLAFDAVVKAIENIEKN